MTFRTVYHVARILFGAWFVAMGVEFFLPWDIQPLGTNPLAHEYTLALIHSGLFHVIKIGEIAIGLSVLANRFMPAVLAGCLPITLGIVHWNMWLEHSWFEWSFGIATVVLHAILLWPWRRYYCALFVWKGNPDY